MIALLVETDTGGATEITLETIAFARSLAVERGGDTLHAVVIGATPDGVADQLAAHGVSEVTHISGGAFATYCGAAWAAAIQQVHDRVGVDVICAAGSPRGSEILAHLAARLNVAMAANVVSFSTTAPLTVHRQVVGGAALEEMTLVERPALLTVAGHAWTAQPADAPVHSAWREDIVDVPAADLLARVVATRPKEPDQSGALKSARVVVGVGRGVGGPNGFDDVAELAQLLGGAIGVSRVVTSLGWRPHHEQVGQTGSRISPELYIACGISGAIQHWAGCASSKTILAINTDPDAPMVTKAGYAVIGDMHEILPAINAEIRRRAATQ